MNDHTPPEGGALEPGSSEQASGGEAAPFGDMMVSCMVVPGRRVRWSEYAGSSPVWSALQGRSFCSADDLAAFVGEFYGHRSAVPTHGGPEVDGIAWWINDTMTMLYLGGIFPGLTVGYSTFVPSLVGITPDEHAALVAIAHEAAGLVTMPVEACS